ncbi:MAG: YihY/virulence factor BrkB family protein [Planctomycetales bacterium]
MLELVENNASPWLAQQLQRLLAEIQTQAAIGGPVGLLFLLVSAMGVFVQLDASLARMWGVAHPPRGFFGILKTILWDRLIAFLLLFGMGGLVLVLFVGNLVWGRLILSWLPWMSGHFVTRHAPPWGAVLVSALLFGTIYKALPRAPVRWRAAWFGGLFTAVTFKLGQQGLEAVVIGNHYSAYGVVGSFLAVMLWMYYASAVVLLGAELVRALEGSGE